MLKSNDEIKIDGGSTLLVRFLIFALVMLVALFGTTYKLLLDRMDKQESVAAQAVTELREEIKVTKADNKDSLNAASIASKDAVAATASALKDAVAATALASKESMAATASALRDAVAATAVASKDAVTATATSLSDRLNTLSVRLDRLEDKVNDGVLDHRHSYLPSGVKAP